MRPSLLRLAQHRTPLIKFLGKRIAPKPSSIDHTPHLHPADPHASLPDSFAESFVQYRDRVENPGADGESASPTSTSSSSGPQVREPAKPQENKPYGLIGGKTGKELGPVAASEGEYFDVSELPRRFKGRMEWTDKEMEAVMSGGASMW